MLIILCRYYEFPEYLNEREMQDYEVEIREEKRYIHQRGMPDDDDSTYNPTWKFNST